MTDNSIDTSNENPHLVGSFGLAILAGLNKKAWRTGIYEGTVSYAEVAKRRKAGRAARASRRANR